MDTLSILDGMNLFCNVFVSKFQTVKASTRLTTDRLGKIFF